MKVLHQHLHVVSANAGTHTPRTINVTLQLIPELKHKRRWLWVPAFAGTTY